MRGFLQMAAKAAPRARRVRFALIETKPAGNCEALWELMVDPGSLNNNSGLDNVGAPMEILSPLLRR